MSKKKFLIVFFVFAFLFAVFAVGGCGGSSKNYYPSNNNDYPSGENEIEYEYCTWEDNTDFILDNECSILECQFDLEVNLDKETKDNLELFKKEIENKRTSINDDIKYIETVNCPDFNDYETCFLKAPNFFEKILPILWFISFITGYLNIIDIFINYKFEKIYVKIKKVISNTNLYRAKYKEFDENYEKYKTLDGKEKYTPFYTIELNKRPLLNEL